VVFAIGIALFLAPLVSDDACSKRLDYLLALYDSYGLPHPPPDASLVLLTQGHGIPYENDSAGFGKWSFSEGPTLGFTRDGKTALDEFGKPFAVGTIKPVKPDPNLTNDADLGWLEDAIQFHARGWKSLAVVSFRKWMERYSWWTPEKKLHSLAWDHWKCRLHHDPDMPLATIAKRLKQIHPHLKAHSAEERNKLLDSLELALKPRNSPPGSVEALIDQLIEARGQHALDLWVTEGVRADPRYRAILRKGLDAVPALISHLNDERQTRSYWNVCGWKDLRVKEVAFDILMQLNGGPFPLDGWMDMPENAEALKEWSKIIGDWYSTARKLGEEKYIVSRIPGEDETDAQLRPGLLWLLAEKYPQRLPEVFRKCVDTRPGHSQFAREYAKFVADSRIPEADKRKLLEYSTTRLQHQFSAEAIEYLRRFEPKFAKEQIIQNLKSQADFSTGSAVLAFIVATRADEDEWKALAHTLRRAKPSKQIDMISAVLCAKTPGAQKERLAFLADFLTDEALASGPKDRRAPAEARHFAEGQLADLLKIETAPYLTAWTAEGQWNELRDQVKELLWP
jgi:hypothetical protein